MHMIHILVHMASLQEIKKNWCSLAVLSWQYVLEEVQFSNVQCFLTFTTGDYMEKFTIKQILDKFPYNQVD